MVSERTEWEPVINLLRELVAWTRFQALPALKKALEDEMDDDRKKLAYEYTDGRRPRREVAKLAGVPEATLQGWWRQWYNIGIVAESEHRAGRMARLCSLRDVAIDVPRLKEEAHEEEPPEPEEGAI